MKKVILLAAAVLAGIYTAKAQGGGGFHRPSVEERVKTTSEKLAPLNLGKEQLTKTQTVFTDFFKTMDKQREDMRASGERPDRQVMMDKMKKAADERDEKLKGIFTEDQLKKWKDDIEPALRAAHRPGGKGGKDMPPPPPGS